MLSIHCGAHRLALASSQAADSITYLKRFDSHLITLFYYFKNSAVREAALHQIQEVMDEPVLRAVLPGGCLTIRLLRRFGVLCLLLLKEQLLRMMLLWLVVCYMR